MLHLSTSLWRLRIYKRELLLPASCNGETAKAINCKACAYITKVAIACLYLLNLSAGVLVFYPGILNAIIYMLRWIDVLLYAKYSNPEPARRVEKTEEAWQQHLTPEQFHVTRLKGTERAYRNAYCRLYDPGLYACVGCGSLLFNASEKYHAISGWPSFTQPIAKGAIKYAFDDSHKMHRIEALCNVCDCHLGHVFNDGPAPAGLRYCINSASLQKLDTPA